MDDDLFMAGRLDDHTSLCISSLPRKTLEEAEIVNLGSDRGYFVYEIDETPLTGGMRILAKVASLEAAFRLLDIWKMKNPEPDPA